MSEKIAIWYKNWYKTPHKAIDKYINTQGLKILLLKKAIKYTPRITLDTVPKNTGGVFQTRPPLSPRKATPPAAARSDFSPLFTYGETILFKEVRMIIDKNAFSLILKSLFKRFLAFILGLREVFSPLFLFFSFDLLGGINA